MRATKSVSNMLTAVMAAKGKSRLDQSCVQLACLSFVNPSWNLAKIQSHQINRKWDAHPVFQVWKEIDWYSRALDVTFFVYTYDDVTGGANYLSKIGKPKSTSARHCSLMLVDFGTWLHCLPFADLDEKMIVQKPVTAAAAVPATLPAGVVNPLPPAAQIAAPTTAAPVTAVVPPAPPTQATVPPPQQPSSAPPAGPWVRMPPGEWGFAGVEQPRIGLMRWIKGFGCSHPDRTVFESISDLARPVLVANAITNTVALYGADVLYYELRSGTSMRPGKVVVDGEVYSTFSAGDIVTVGGDKYSVNPVVAMGVPLLKLLLLSSGVVGSIKRALTLRPNVSVELVHVQKARVPSVRPLTQSRAEWLMAVNTATDPHCNVVLGKMRHDIAEEDFGPGTETAHDATEWVAQLRKVWPSNPTVMGPYIWGYCYSCGKPPPGKFRGRLCEQCAKGTNLELGEMVASGHRVTSHAAPVVYPGVVHTKTETPKLKQVATSATPENFQAVFRGAPSN
jgi:hypothetical protein